MAELPIRLISVFKNFTISNCFKEYEDMEKWMDSKKLELVSSYQLGDYICCLAATEDVSKEKLI